MTKVMMIIFVSLYLVRCQAFWNMKDLQEYFNKYISFTKHDIKGKKPANEKGLKKICDENQLLLQLARLYITSPERVILLLSANSISKTCQDIPDVLEHINKTISDCIPLKSDNLYMKLNDGLDYFNSYICQYNPSARETHLVRYVACFKELREDLQDCEGLPDWFEKTDKGIVCQHYNDIINCNYVKAALLCGLEPAYMLRSFSNEIMTRIVKFKCKISRSLPHIDDPMPAKACHFKCHINLRLCIYFVFQLYMHLFIQFSYLYT